ncbi:succinate dehydrogenase assembly factor 2 [Succinimonas sp.]|uniref:FAD assembly factor SdhE n=1 Tax=Succinimonas sp. TaxID=1936151 RepID=UPI0038686460
MITAGRLDSLKWQSRRGMKEIDLMLEPFVTRHIPDLPEETVSFYEKLLLCSDLELIRYLLRNVTPEDPDLRKIVDLVISCHKQDFPDAAQGLE